MRRLAVHLEIDTGMARQGVAPGEELRELLEWLAAQPELRLDGVMTHFASSEVAGSPLTLRAAGAVRAGAAAGCRRLDCVRSGFMRATRRRSITVRSAEHDAARWSGCARLRLGSARARWCGPGLRSMDIVCRLRGGEALVRACASAGDDVEDAGDRRARGARLAIRLATTRSLRRSGRCGWRCLPVGYADGLRRELSGSDDARGRMGDGAGTAGDDCGSRVDESYCGRCDGDSRASALAMRWCCWAMALRRTIMRGWRIRLRTRLCAA